jgi:hypothetical protein
MRPYSESVKADVRHRMSTPRLQSVAEIAQKLGIHVIASSSGARPGGFRGRSWGTSKANKHPGPKPCALGSTCLNVNNRCEPSWPMTLWSPAVIQRRISPGVPPKQGQFVAYACSRSAPASGNREAIWRLPGAGLDGPSPWRGDALPIAQ